MPRKKVAAAVAAVAAVPRPSTAPPHTAPPATEKRKTHPTGNEHTQKKPTKNSPKRKSLQNIAYISLTTPPFPVDSETFPLKVDGKDYTWSISEKGKKYFEEMLQASDNCNADQWGVYVYNDFSGYGQLELLENAVSFPEDIGRTKILVKDYINSWKKEFRKPRARKPEELFFHTEGLVLYLSAGDIQYAIIDDGERVASMQDLIATVFLETFILLEGNGLLAADSPLKNIGLVAALIVNWGDCEKKSAIRRIVRMCKDAEIEVALGPKGWVDGVGVEKFIAGMEGGDKGEDDDMDEDEDDEDEWETEEDEDETQDAGFRKQLRHYKSILPVSKMGGHEFDLSKWTEAERKRYSLDNEDGEHATARPVDMFHPRGRYIVMSP